MQSCRAQRIMFASPHMQKTVSTAFAINCRTPLSLSLYICSYVCVYSQPQRLSAPKQTSFIFLTGMANPMRSVPLYEKVVHKNATQRVLDVTVLFLLLCLLVYRLLSVHDHGFAWFLAFLCESFFTFIWVLVICSRWTPISYKTYPQRLQKR